MMLESIHTEHGYINRLLNILQQKLVAIENGQPVNYSLIKDIVEYLHKHAECCHHPKEDLLYRYYQQHYAESAEMQNLEAEHIALSGLTHDFADTVDMILMDAVIPLDVFADKLNTFVHNRDDQCSNLLPAHCCLRISYLLLLYLTIKASCRSLYMFRTVSIFPLE